VSGIEYGLQAMAIHGALRGGTPQPVGYLVRLGDVRCNVDFLDQLGTTLTVRAELVQSLASGYSYGFAIAGGDLPANAGRIIPPAIVGRATIALVG
jgi:predicted hotdog family 3-hydroxylacyl-ACP dehydratase